MSFLSFCLLLVVQSKGEIWTLSNIAEWGEAQRNKRGQRRETMYENWPVLNILLLNIFNSKHALFPINHYDKPRTK